MSHFFSAGKYYVGDPCYVVSNRNWIRLLNQTDFFEKEVFQYKGEKCFASGTLYGDGSYYDNQGRVYSVDAGLIGIMPVESLDKNKSGKGGNIIEFDSEFEVYEGGGVFHFGNLEINTGDELYEDE